MFKRGDTMNFDLSMSQQLSQTLTTELIQHLEVLQFSEEELKSYIYEKASENPFINVLDHDIQSMKNVMDYSLYQFSDSTKKLNNETYSFLQTNITHKEPVEKALLEQIPLHQDLNELDRKILKYLIYHLDDYYFLKIDLESVINRFNVEASYLESLIDLLQTFEPIGVGARDFTEYLLIKIANDPFAPELATAFVQDHLELVANYSIKALSKTYKVSTKEAKEAVDYIRNLKPPMSQCTDIRDEFIVADVEVKKVQGEWVIDVLNPNRPKIEMNEEYVALLKDNMEHQDYYKKCLKDYMLLTQGINQRDKTIYSVSRVLLNLQPAFFESGIAALAPLTLKEVASVLEVHESTISRAIRNKYIRTPHGIFAFRNLFTRGISNTSGKMDSVQYIKKRIQELVASEDKSKPYSDQQITNELVSEGIQISRRTVAKYREELNILSSSKRLYA